MYLFLHHCDLRIPDNTTLYHLISNEIPFTPIFIFTPEQVVSNPYKSENAIQFMIESLQDLEKQYAEFNIKLHYFRGDTVEVLEDLINKNNIDGIAFNDDYSPYAKHRDQLVEDLFDAHNKKCIHLEDKLLNPIDLVLTGKDTPYSKFTPYYNKALTFDVREPNPLVEIKQNLSEVLESDYAINLKDIEYKNNSRIAVHGGRSSGLEILKNITKFKNYNQNRNNPSIPTTRLSAHLKFGTISPREVYYLALEQLGDENEIIKQLYWRDFYSMILHNYGTVDVPVSITKPKFNAIKWDNSEEEFKKWKEGKTGCPIVDAGMREMNTTGYMHNRARMIVAMYLIYFLRIDWRWGMKYFSQKLVDADWANNTGNWQWCAGVENWSNDYYKVFSMESQMERFDPDCEYIKKWAPELGNLSPKEIIKMNANMYKEMRMEGIQMYKDI